jgi:hypothetical protein
MHSESYICKNTWRALAHHVIFNLLSDSTRAHPICRSWQKVRLGLLRIGMNFRQGFCLVGRPAQSLQHAGCSRRVATAVERCRFLSGQSGRIFRARSGTDLLDYMGGFNGIVCAVHQGQSRFKKLLRCISETKNLELFGTG